MAKKCRPQFAKDNSIFTLSINKNKMKIFALLISLLCCTTNIMGQISIKEVIGNIPDEILPYITNDQKEELLKFTGSKDSVKVKNTFNGATSIDTISFDYAKINMNKTTEMQLKLLRGNDSTQILCVIKTIKSPLKESTVKFYSTEWQAINSTFGLPVDNDEDTILSMFTQKPDSMPEDKFKNLYNCIEPVMLAAQWDEKSNCITFNLSIPFIQKDNNNEINAIIKKISFKWDGQNFKKC